MLHFIIAILGGAIAASALITERKPETSKFINAIKEYKSFIGVLLLFWGARGMLKLVFRGLSNSGGLITICTYAAEFVVGFLLAYELLEKYVFKKSDKASEIGEDMKSSLSKYQVPAGLALIVLGILSVFS